MQKERKGKDVKRRGLEGPSLVTRGLGRKSEEIGGLRRKFFGSGLGCSKVD